MPRRWGIRVKYTVAALLSLFVCVGAVGQSLDDLACDLEMVAYLDALFEERLPLTFNHRLSTGYFTTHSARMGEPGEISLGGAHVPPYLLASGRIQPFSHLELSGNYRYHHGSIVDRGANFKFALLTNEQSDNVLPGIAIGVDDFIGIKRFRNYYVVATQMWLPLGLECSVGWEAGQRSRHGPTAGFFGGAAWFPFWNGDHSFLEGFALAAEVDPEKEADFPCNIGAKYNFRNLVDLSASYIQGEHWAFGGALNFNWGEGISLFAKTNDPPPFQGQCVAEEGILDALAEAFSNQGFYLRQVWVEEVGRCKKRLTLSLLNNCYRQESVARYRIERLLEALLPACYSEIVVIVEASGLPCQQYVYQRNLLHNYLCRHIGNCEFDLLTPRTDVTFPRGQCRFNCPAPTLNYRFSPRFETFFGSGFKNKYDLGAKADFEGVLPYDLFYEFGCSYTILSDVPTVAEFDAQNNSPLPNVLTDYVLYRQKRNFCTDRAYLQKGWNLGEGWFGRLSTGYFQIDYAGAAGEVLWYPAEWNVALGLEGALLKKRKYTGLGFQSTIRQKKGDTTVFHPYTLLNQYFLSIYFDIPEFCLDTKLSIGGFLAHDKGGRIEVSRYFASGLRFTGWMTYSNAAVGGHGENFFNRGIAIEIPLDLFSRCSSRKVWSYGLGAWLRDAGAFTRTGRPLFDIINRERRL